MRGRKNIAIKWSMATAHCFADPLRLRGGCAVNFSVVAPGRGRLWVPRNQRSVTSSKSNPHKSAQTSMLITDAYKDKPPRGSPNKGERSIWSRATALSRAIWSEFVGVGKAFALISFHGLDFCCAVGFRFSVSFLFFLWAGAWPGFVVRGGPGQFPASCQGSRALNFGLFPDLPDWKLKSLFLVNLEISMCV